MNSLTSVIIRYQMLPVPGADRTRARLVYVDNDPMVFLHAEALMAKDKSTSVIRADLRDTAEVLRQAGELLDFSQPIALLLIATLHHIKDEDDPTAIVTAYVDALAPGSYLALSNFTSEFAPERLQMASELAEQRGVIIRARSKQAIAAMFGGRPLVDPGLVLISRWRPDDAPDPNADRAWAFGGIAPL
jgi:hypothetical protein